MTKLRVVSKVDDFVASRVTVNFSEVLFSVQIGTDFGVLNIPFNIIRHRLHSSKNVIELF